ncbi:MAG TPA: cupin-like domain-containing protein, partial [Rhizomicrobium sp.]
MNTGAAQTALPRTTEWRNVDAATFRKEIIPRDRPAVLKGLVADWPVVQAARQSPQALYDYLRARDQGQPTQTYVASPGIKGLFFYRDDMTGLNFERVQQPFHATVAAILAQMNRPDAPAIYAPAATAALLPTFTHENRLDIVDADIVPRLWAGNAVTAATHYDMSDGLACVAAGRKRFTFFPPEQLPNLYVGPLDLAPGGLPTSMVQVTTPDLARYPRFTDALAVAEVAELEPGDAVFIPNMWWHNVVSRDPVNLLVNYWWFEGTRGPASPFAALALGLMAITALPASRRGVWRRMFDHYVFQTDGDPASHLPPDKRGMLGAMNPHLESYMRTQIIRSLIRPLPRQQAEQI